MEQIRRFDRIDFQFERRRQIGLERQSQSRHDGVRGFIVRPVEHQRATGLGDKIEQPFRHFFIERGKHRQQIVFAPLLKKRLQRINGVVIVTVIVASGVDEMNKIARERIRTGPGQHVRFLYWTTVLNEFLRRTRFMLPNFPARCKRGIGSDAIGENSAARSRLDKWLLFADDFHQHSFSSTAVELPVKNLLPWTEVQLAARDGHHHLPPHDLTFHVSVAVVLAGVVVSIARVVRSEPFEKLVVVAQEAWLVVIDVDAGGDVHGVHQYQALPHSASLDRRFNLRGDVEISPSRFGFEPEFFAVGFHGLTAVIVPAGPTSFKRKAERRRTLYH
ncbi:protein of unknown function [Candidatus Nitrospira inopinata]|uniref:Uncharacterized protein n=1 Tax=Candidatus Nitrospira inopinata TaxID=1715989 RepID=A0A0S4KRJ7_9BACT|nr:protein of unknown function [Candidatus Nitrospira inopinata]